MKTGKRKLLGLMLHVVLELMMSQTEVPLMRVCIGPERVNKLEEHSIEGITHAGRSSKMI